MICKPTISRFIPSLFIGILILGAVAWAQPQAPGPDFGGPHMFMQRGPERGMHRGPMDGMHPLLPPGRWWKNDEVAKTLNLSDAQVQKIEQIFQDSRLKLVDIHANLEKEEIKLEPLLEADNPDESAVLGAIDRIAAARTSLWKANAEMAFAIRRVLTPEQWKKLREFRHHDHFPLPMRGPRDGMKDGNRRWQAPPPPPPGSSAPGDAK